MNSSNQNIRLLKPSLSNKLGVLLLSFFVMLIAVSLLKGLVESVIVDFRSAFLITSVLQSLLVFILPAWFAAFLCSDKPYSYIGVSERVSFRQFLAVIIFMIVMMPAINYIVDWNENITLPSFMSAFEQTMRNMEDSAAAITDMILDDTSVWGLVSGLLVVGVITGIAEESFFRAGLQKSFSSSGINHHIAIWVAAFIFSAIHFQFFGFIPRMLLGATFGYMYQSSGSLWIPASAHALNNSIVVVTAWLANRGYLNADIELFGVEGNHALLWLSLSVAASLLFIFCFWKNAFRMPEQKPGQISVSSLKQNING